ncbi:hypothetical protein BC936DRAFT_148126 [Jimgerdemannia flammicorona]|uniref:Uncharacterized protein n=1 Tax=Jimgerdemannia flammicorona TaxID=994334 RepID=A0A433DKT8_9FUNG|nr:hypothetical protein BC936DRAFT_148126 [Jimgerdemannia flammicorona]
MLYQVGRGRKEGERNIKEKRHTNGPPTRPPRRAAMYAREQLWKLWGARAGARRWRKLPGGYRTDLRGRYDFRIKAVGNEEEARLPGLPGNLLHIPQRARVPRRRQPGELIHSQHERVRIEGLADHQRIFNLLLTLIHHPRQGLDLRSPDNDLQRLEQHALVPVLRCPRDHGIKRRHKASIRADRYDEYLKPLARGFHPYERFNCPHEIRIVAVRRDGQAGAVGWGGVQETR